MSEFDNVDNLEEAASEEYLNIDAKKSKSLAFAVLSLIFSALSIVLCFVFWLNLAFAALGIIFCVVSRLRMGYFHGISIAGLIVGIIGAIFSLFYIFVFSAIIASYLA